MAEQEACAELVEKASEESGKKEPGSIQGESLLLPLLQGLLDAPENEQTADSGTESGEDLRSGLILEVQSALDKLSASLKGDSGDISSERRDSLLQLVARLQAGLSTQLTTPSSSERRASLQARFARRRQRANRHTVGVTSEELEDARRLMQEIAFRDIVGSTVIPPLQYSPLKKQHSEGSVVSSAPFKPLKQKVKPVKNLTAKPFISSTNTSQSQSGTSSTVETPTETSESLDFLTSSPEKSQTDVPEQEGAQVQLREKKPQYVYHQSISLEPEKPVVTQKRPLSEAMSLDYSREVDLKSVQKAVTQAAAIKQLSQLKSDVSESTQDSETDDDPVTIKIIPQQAEKPQTQEAAVTRNQPAPQPDLILQTNPVYLHPDNSDSDNDDCPSRYGNSALDGEKANRFSSKKLKMKRANTIDIPKPLKYYECDDDDTDGEAERDFNARRSSYLALRGPIGVGKLNATAKKVVPDFEPKTESDRKFAAFINKHSENGDVDNKASVWAKRAEQSASNWSNKFGHIKTTFEKVGNDKGGVSSARNFWKSADDAVTAGKVSHIGPKISRQSARNLQQMFEEKQKQSQQKTPWSNTSNRNVVTGSLKVDTKAFEASNRVKVVTQPNSVNKFSHAPMSAFKPVPKKSELPLHQIQTNPIKPQALSLPTTVVGNNVAESQSSTPETPLYLYSPKPLSPQNEGASPLPYSTPWLASRSGDSRVLSIAVSKFETVAADQQPAKPQRPDKEKITIPPALQQVAQPEKLTSPFLVKSLGQNNSVRKLSGQYDHLEAKNSYPLKYGSSYSHQNHQPQETGTNLVSHNQNYSAHHQQPPHHYLEQPKVYNAAYTISTQYYNVPQGVSQLNNSQIPQDNLSRESFARQSKNYSSRVEAALPQYNSHPKASMQPDPYQHAKLPKQVGTIYGHPQQVAPQHCTQPQVYQKQFPNHQEDTQQYTSSYQFKPQRSINHRNQKSPDHTERLARSQFVSNGHQSSVQPYLEQQAEPLKIFDYPSPPTSPAKRPTYETQTSQESVKEYTAVSSRVMSGPVSQQAVTVQQKSPKSRDQHDMDAAFNLKMSLEKFSKVESNDFHVQRPLRQPLSTQSFKIRPTHERPTLQHQKSLPEDNNPPSGGGHVVYNNVTGGKASRPKAKAPNFYVNDEPMSLESLEINERGESVLTSKFHIPMAKNSKSNAPHLPSPGQILSKSESWHQICQGVSATTTNKSSPTSSPNSKPVSRSKSSHTLAVPKQFEAGMSKSEMLEKKRSIEAYFGGGGGVDAIKTHISKTEGKMEAKKSAINRVKTSQKISTQRQNSGLCRSRTLPDIVCPDKLDESNIDEVFEDLFKSST